MRKPRWLAAALVVLVIAAAAFGWIQRERQIGAAVFSGERAVVARILGHDIDLPSQASRCINCHGENAKGADSVNGAGGLGAPALNGGTLRSSIARRGGPPSHYDGASLCTLLRSGVDPAHVMITRTMPRYTLTDADCAALWAYLSNR